MVLNAIRRKNIQATQSDFEVSMTGRAGKRSAPRPTQPHVKAAPRTLSAPHLSVSVFDPQEPDRKNLPRPSGSAAISRMWTSDGMDEPWAKNSRFPGELSAKIVAPFVRVDWRKYCTIINVCGLTR